VRAITNAIAVILLHGISPIQALLEPPHRESLRLYYGFMHSQIIDPILSNTLLNHNFPKLRL
jgi:hypothetical protein